MQVAQGDLPNARLRYEESLAIDQRLAKADHSSAGLQRDVSVSLNKIGDVLVAQGDLPNARLRYEESLAIAQRLAKADPSSTGLQRDIALSYWKLALLENQETPGSVSPPNGTS